MAAREAPGDRRRLFHPRFLPYERRKGNFRALWGLAAAILLFGLCDRYLACAGKITDVSMLPTLPDGRYLLINKWTYRLRPPRRGEIVVLRAPGKEHWSYVKRVVGLPGETVVIQAGRIRVNGRVLREPYALGKTYPEMGPLQIPEEAYFVLGDNRSNSEDSRQFGPVPRGRILGKI